MVNPRNALHLTFKLHAGRIGTGGSFQVFCGAQLCKHLTFDTAFFTACCYPSRFIAAAVRLRCILIFCCCVRRSSCASWRIMLLLAAGSRFASKALNQSSTFCSSATFHRPHFFRFIRFRYRFNARHTAVSADQHTLRQLQVKTDITDIVAQNIHLKGE